ncbi:protein OBERON 3-like [Hibiscus syriacus]|uniref:Protein OBERON 3-like n=1 Tax=Hibiscus syriacus TaxID=106335 RepID=A0A6A3BHW6_HIBSY|nr:protein OBERON 3-like [Hibiscus syriacus]
MDETNSPDMYTLHSWLGMSAICLFGLQYLLGFFSYVFPGAESYTRAAYQPWHSFGGLVIFLLAIGTAEMGLLHRFLWLGLVRARKLLLSTSLDCCSFYLQLLLSSLLFSQDNLAA